MEQLTTNEIAPSDVTTECEKCSATYLVKYWDEELDWYIEMNLSNYCRTCQESNSI